MSVLTLPGTIPGLLRRGSPLVTSQGPSVVFSNDQVGSSIRIADDVFLDLTDATGRAHAAWWLAGRMPASHRPRHNPLETVSWVAGSFGWCLTGMREGHRGWRRDEARSLQVGVMPEVLPALSDLDPNDARLLPDGSRWVDAEALRRVVLHVAGMPS